MPTMVNGNSIRVMLILYRHTTIPSITVRYSSRPLCFALISGDTNFRLPCSNIRQIVLNIIR